MAKQPRELLLDITAITPDGLGVASADERTYHVRNALPGEQVRARILKRRKGVRFADAIAVEGTPNVDRVDSICEYFPRCGGCSLHHQRYAAGLALKQSHLLRQLREKTVEVPCIAPPVSAGRLGYRRKARLGVRKVGQQVLVGFRESFSSRVSKIDICQTLTKEISSLVKPLKEILLQLSVADKIPQIEVAQGDHGVVLTLRHLAPLSAADVNVLQTFAREHDVDLLTQAGGYETVTNIAGGPVPLLSYTLPEFGLYFEFDPRQFTQVNAGMNQLLVSHALAYLNVQSNRQVADLFCGIGNFSLAIARQGGRVSGYEAEPGAIDRAQANASLNGLASKTSFEVRDLYSEPLSLAGVEAILLDPPRSGAGPLLAEWVTSAGSTLQKIVYVSCNPVSFAADAHTLGCLGFALKEVGVYDMFPHTSHVETIGHFCRVTDG